MSDDLLTAAKNAHATIAAFYQWADRVEKAGGTTCIAGVAEAHAMLSSMKKQKPRLDKLITEPLMRSIQDAQETEKAK